MKAFLMLLPQLLEDFFQKALIGFGEYEMGLKKKSFACKCCGNDREFNWKTRHGKETAILTKGYCTLGLVNIRVNVSKWSTEGALNGDKSSSGVLLQRL